MVGSGPGLSKCGWIGAGVLVAGLTGVARASEAPLIVVGFMGGRVHAGNMVHREARVAATLERRYPGRVKGLMFANRDEPAAMAAVLMLLGRGAKSDARIVVFGHSWGASETVNFARQLNERGIPVLLTVQVDSVQKLGEDDASIPPNVREAVNFYQTAGMLHGRRVIRAEDPAKTKVLGNFESSYKPGEIAVDGYSWYSRMFMRPHIEIENDDALWTRIEAMIAAKVQVADPGAAGPA